MIFWDKLKAYVAADVPPPVADSYPPDTSEIGWENSLLYSGKDFPKYNPDTLMHRKGARIYRRMMQDDQVKAVLRFKQHAVVSRSWYFDVGLDEAGNERTDHQEMAAFLTHAVKQIQGSFSAHLIGILSALPYGFSITEKIHAPIQWQGKSMWGVKTLKLRPFDSFDGGFETDVHGNILALKQAQGGNPTPIPLDKVIHFVHQPDLEAHYGESDLKACYRDWWSKDVSIKFQNIHLERHASGFIWAKVNGGLTTQQKNNLQSLIRNISARMGAVVPGAVDLNSMQPLRTDAYDRAIAQYDKAIAKSLLVPNLLGLSEQGDTGSYSQSSIQLKVFFWVLDALAGQLEEALNEQLFADLARWNFGTDDFPRFKFEPISDDQKREIAAGWAELVSKNAVTQSDSDEIWLRQMYGAPEKSEETAALEEDQSEGASGGASGELDFDKLKAMADAYGLCVRSGAITPQMEDEKYFRQASRLPDIVRQVEDATDALPDNDEWIEAQGEDSAEMIRREFAAKPWLRRIDFARMETAMNSADAGFLADLACIMAGVHEDLDKLISKIGGERSWGNVDPREIEKISLPKKSLSVLRKTIRGHLQQILRDGYVQARSELPKKTQAKVIRPGMDKTQAEKFLASRAMKIAGVIEQDVLKAVQRVLENAIKYDKNLKQTLDAIRDDTDLLKLLPDYDAQGNPVNKAVRLEAIVRTNTADAVNQARMALFREPEFTGFVQAFEYSAALDSRTTDICEHLNGRILRDFGAFVPPNHHMCRSILVPVTAVDDWDGQESPRPRLQPHKGFA